MEGGEEVVRRVEGEEEVRRVEGGEAEEVPPGYSQHIDQETGAVYYMVGNLFRYFI